MGIAITLMTSLSNGMIYFFTSNNNIFFDTDGEEQWKAGIDLASHRMMETYF